MLALCQQENVSCLYNSLIELIMYIIVWETYIRRGEQYRCLMMTAYMYNDVYELH